MGEMDWVVLLPVKSASTAKSRLAPAFPDPLTRAAVVRAMRTDTVSAVRATADVIAIVAAVDRFETARDLGPGVDVVVQQSPGLNAALGQADAAAATRYPGAGRIAIVGDLPGLTPNALRAVLAAAAGVPRAFVADLAGTGTTMLAVQIGPLEPRFGAGSAQRHAESATRLAAPPAARHDVDLPRDLSSPLAGGFGPATRVALAHAAAADAPPTPAPGVHRGTAESWPCPTPS